MNHFVNVRTRQADFATAFMQRALGRDDATTIVGEEPVPPNQRPSLPKADLLGEMKRERIFLKPEANYAEIGIRLAMGTSLANDR